MPTRSFEELKLLLNEKGVRKTKKRDLILQTFLEMEGHPTIEDLLVQVRKKDPKIGYVTVYRTLKMLKEFGMVHQRQFGEGHSRFEQVSDHHDHLICMGCHAVFEFEEEKIEKLQDEICSQNQFQMLRHIHEIYGYCKQCQRKPYA